MAHHLDVLEAVRTRVFSSSHPMPPAPTQSTFAALTCSKCGVVSIAASDDRWELCIDMSGAEDS